MQCEGAANEIQGPLRQNAEGRQRFLSYLADLERTGRPFVVRNASVALASLSLPLMASHCGATRNDMYNQISSTWTPGSHLGRADRLLANAYLRLRCMLVAASEPSPVRPTELYPVTLLSDWLLFDTPPLPLGG